jgi:hypothetical protein
MAPRRKPDAPSKGSSSGYLILLLNLRVARKSSRTGYHHDVQWSGSGNCTGEQKVPLPRLALRVQCSKLRASMSRLGCLCHDRLWRHPLGHQDPLKNAKDKLDVLLNRFRLWLLES